MGIIQASLNQLTGSLFGGIRNVALAAKAMKSMGEKPEAPATKKPVSETADFQEKLQMASPRVRGVSPKLRAVGRFKADEAALSGNDLIMQKSRSSFDIASRLSMLGGNE